jgi:hypothetical protein
MRESYRLRRGSTWLNERLDEMHADLCQRETRYRRIAGWTFLGFMPSFSAAMQWPIHVGDTLGTIGFWSAILSGGVCWYAWNAARIEASLMNIPLDREQ